MKENKIRGVGGKILLVVLGFLPMAGGWLFNWYIMHDGSTRFFSLISLGFFFLWGLLAFAVRPLAKSAKEAALLLNAVAAVDLLLMMIQELILGSYWFNWVGRWTQFFFLLPLPIGSTLDFWGHRTVSAALMSFVLMVLASWLGANLRPKSGRG